MKRIRLTTEECFVLDANPEKRKKFFSEHPWYNVYWKPTKEEVIKHQKLVDNFREYIEDASEEKNAGKLIFVGPREYGLLKEIGALSE